MTQVTLTLNKKQVTWNNIPEHSAAIAIKYNRPPIGRCSCNNMAYIQHSAYYICERCLRIENELSYCFDFTRAGKNIHRTSGRKVVLASNETYHVNTTNYGCVSDGLRRRH